MNKDDWLIVIIKKEKRKELGEYIAKHFKNIGWVNEEIGDYVMLKFFRTRQIITKLSMVISSFNSQYPTDIIQITKKGQIQ